MESISRLLKFVNNLDNVCVALITIPTVFGREKISYGIREIHCSSKVKSSRSLKKCRVAVVGLGGVGQSLAHLLKTRPIGLSELRLCSRSDLSGIVEDLTHIPTGVRVTGFEGRDGLADGLAGAEVVIVSAGAARKVDTPREQLFLENAEICKDIISCVSENCPDALVAIVSNPVDSLVPVAAEVMKNRGTYRPSKLFGICELDNMRSRLYYGEAIDRESSKTYVPVIGGHSEDTTVPLFSQARPRVRLSDEKVAELTVKVREAGKRVVLAKKGTGGSTWSMASGAMYFVHQLCRAINHEPHVITSAYVESDVTEARFFSNRLLLGPEGVEENFGYGEITEFEMKLVESAVKILQNNISIAREFIKNHDLQYNNNNNNNHNNNKCNDK